MPKYLFTSDQRISVLEERIKWVANYIQEGNIISEITDKSENNNSTTLQFYYNLYKETKICQLSAQNPICAIQNFIRKFQFPNVRTSESLIDTLEEGVCLAPFRAIIKILFYLAKNDI